MRSWQIVSLSSLSSLSSSTSPGQIGQIGRFGSLIYTIEGAGRRIQQSRQEQTYFMYWLKIRLATLEKRIINELYRIIYLFERFERFERLCLCRCGGCLLRLRLLFLLLLLLLGLAGLRRRNRESLRLQPCVVLRCNSAVCLGSTECDGSPEILLERLRAHLAIFQKCLGFAIFGHTNLMALHKFWITGTLRHFES